MERLCARHPGESAVYYCAKYRRYLCAECLACQDPALYCKSRTMCVIWEDARHGPGETEGSVRPAP